jgi:threonylcarbamoyladenosine tRNA methylthiotransferase MtaB
MSPEEVILEFKHLLDEDYKEIILTGVNVGDYGNSFNTDLCSLLSKLVEIEGEFRIRISSIEPNLLSDDILALTAESDKLCKHFHIPLQSGSQKVLRAMQRRYKVEDYEKLIHKTNSIIPDAGIGVDVIVGFPGETNDDFLATHNLLRDLPISYLHVFTYSERPNTIANEMHQKIDIVVRKVRNKILRILSDKKRNDFYNRLIDTDVNVLFEHENSGGMMKGFSSNYIRVAIPYNLELANKFSTVHITKFDNSLCTGNIVDTKKAVDLFIS